MIYIKLHGEQFNVCTLDMIEGVHGISGLNILYILIHYCDVHGMNDMYENGVYDLSSNGLNALSINARPCDINCLHKLSINGLNPISVHIFLVMS